MDSAAGGQPITAGHADIEQGHVGAQLAGQGQRLDAVVGQGNDLDAVGGEQIGQPFQQQAVVIGQ